MAHDFLSQILILLAGSLLVQSLVRRFRLPFCFGLGHPFPDEFIHQVVQPCFFNIQ